jgi:CRP-like cAMP-binding protein
MSNPAALAVLRQSPIFRGLAKPTLGALADMATNRRYESGEAVFREHEQGMTLIGVISGQLRITTTSPDGRELNLNVIKPGEIVGEIAFLDGGTRTATGIAAVPSVCFAIQRAPFFRLVESTPHLATHLLQLVCARVRWTSRLVADSAFLSVPERLAARLADLCNGVASAKDGSVRLEISQLELAAFLGVSRQVVNRYLGDWQQAGHLVLTRGAITVQNLEAILS